MLAKFSPTTVTQVSELRSNADAVFSALDKEDSPGCALVLVRHHHSESYFFIPSRSKQFSAFSLALPEEPHRTSAGIHLMTIAEDPRYAGESERLRASVANYTGRLVSSSTKCAGVMSATDKFPKSAYKRQS